ncbi:3-demethylubiquinone-9 3-O-methyltransferase [Piscirickettsia salmonis]|uniref:class I SAM-dependent methyltransferase n=1 Tax=Piscirickettsia salmonis TaxID=1238 RepID=UPI0012BA8275|nr:class I SAM-dependent methyltransferase [Piscirickettsia salmonis]QGP56585.1 3-demethylubiquinone-9 3-O-methyltransferase [Piscirickettsia salmonis]QGP56611.1 3-demethylubiquinone-9 3-O-methyltransferase [Piscirickettsia salmonis]QGP61393.1 3-demethylubiquinone-9 3-O-methyltransferase [Piscirickettsia salmonis]QGP61417.1 3-demethylubiquinone-9 3-O-methyltransferase [Piscirickettsia salmonis]QGP66151.1 3-demethylubiquinone-9 3-O-methyltransferase [Piscirickettsia salmonis]
MLELNEIKIFSGEKVATQNRTGAMVTNLSDISKQFIKDACQLDEKNIVVDVGCCYGVATLPILKNGKCQIIGIDLAKEHLQVLENQLSSQEKSRFKAITGKFPDIFKANQDSIMAIHASHLLQFLRGEEIEMALKVCYLALKTHGKLYISTTSIHLPWAKDFIPEYYKRKKIERWPGEIHNFKLYTPCEAQNYIQDFFHLLSKSQLVEEMKKTGFEIEHAFSYETDNPAQQADDGKEMIGIIAYKP